MRDPAFWQVTDRRSRASAPMLRLLLTPLSALYAWAGARRIRKATPVVPEAPVVCIGNLTVGGTGKTPLTTWIRQILVQEGVRAATLSRGYGGRLKGPVKVGKSHHSAADVGDEPLMMAQSGESWIGRDRVAAAHAMAAEGVEIILMDDGHQNPTLKKALSIVVIDAAALWGNGFVFPKGPLREPVSTGLARADIVVLMGDGHIPDILTTFKGPTLRTRIISRTAPAPGRYIAFAGIGRPLKFFDTLAAFDDVELAETIPFPDHHPYTAQDMTYLNTLAAERNAILITTEKDYARLSPDQRHGVLPLPVTIDFDTSSDEMVLKSALLKVLAKTT